MALQADLQIDFSGARQAFGQLIADIQSVRIDLGLGANTQLEVRAVAEELRRAGQAADELSQSTQLRVEADVSGAINGLQQVERVAGGLDNQVFRVDADTSAAEQAIGTVQRQSDGLDNQNFRVDADASGALEELQRVERVGDGLDNQNLRVDADASGALAAIRETQRELEGLRGETVTVEIDGDASRLEGLLDGGLPGLLNRGGIIGAALGGAILNAMGDALDRRDAIARLTAALPDDFEQAGATAGEVFGAGFGDSFEQVADVSRLVTQLGDVTEAESARIVTAGLNIADVFGEDVQSQLRAASNLVRTGLASSYTEAFDIITNGFQRGLNSQNDFLDTLIEYPGFFAEAGFSAQDFLGILESGLAGGARNTDIIADSVKNATIESVNGSEAVAAAFEAAGVSQEGFNDAIAEGGSASRAAILEILEGVQGIEDPIARAAAEMALFGSAGEDLSGSFDNLSVAVSDIDDLAGAAERLNEVIAESPTITIESNIREARAEIREAVDPIVGDIAAILAADDVGELFGALRSGSEEESQLLTDRLADGIRGGIADGVLAVPGLFESLGDSINEAFGFEVEVPVEFPDPIPLLLDVRSEIEAASNARPLALGAGIDPAQFREAFGRLETQTVPLGVDVDPAEFREAVGRLEAGDLPLGLTVSPDAVREAFGALEAIQVDPVTLDVQADAAALAAVGSFVAGTIDGAIAGGITVDGDDVTVDAAAIAAKVSADVAAELALTNFTLEVGAELPEDAALGLFSVLTEVVEQGGPQAGLAFASGIVESLQGEGGDAILAEYATIGEAGGTESGVAFAAATQAAIDETEFEANGVLELDAPDGVQVDAEVGSFIIPPNVPPVKLDGEVTSLDLPSSVPPLRIDGQVTSLDLPSTVPPVNVEAVIAEFPGFDPQPIELVPDVLPIPPIPGEEFDAIPNLLEFDIPTQDVDVQLIPNITQFQAALDEATFVIEPVVNIPGGGGANADSGGVFYKPGPGVALNVGEVSGHPEAVIGGHHEAMVAARWLESVGAWDGLASLAVDRWLGSIPELSPKLEPMQIEALAPSVPDSVRLSFSAAPQVNSDPLMLSEMSRLRGEVEQLTRLQKETVAELATLRRIERHTEDNATAAVTLMDRTPEHGPSPLRRGAR